MAGVGSSSVIGVGIDAASVERVGAALDRTPRFAQRVFTDAERRRCEAAPSPPAAFAARFAAKEATMKALGVGIFDAALADIEVVGGGDGAPGLELHGSAARLAADRRVRRWLVSLTHDGGVAAAVVVALS